MSLRILFVDDDQFLLQAIERSLMIADNDWHSDFASSGEEAMERIAQQPYDVIVSDMRMPGMNGAELLEHVGQKYPDTIRIILSGQSDMESAFQTFGPVHQYLRKPCEVEVLKTVIENATFLRNHLQSDEIRKTISSIKKIPALPTNISRISKMLDSSTASAQDVGAEISKDIGMTAKIIQMANSPLFGAGRKLVNPAECVSFLGFDVVHSLIFSHGIFSHFRNLPHYENFVQNLSAHSVNVGARAIAIAKQADASVEVQNYSLLAGLFHDLGKLVLADRFPEPYSELLKLQDSTDTPLWQLEFDSFHASHAEVGAYLLSLWGIPNIVVEAVSFHHQPKIVRPKTFSPLIAVHIANELEKLPLTTDSEVITSQIRECCEAIEFEFPGGNLPFGLQNREALE